MQSSRGRYIKILLGVCIAIVVSVGLFVALVPAILSTQWCQTSFINNINQRIPGTVTAKHISVSWFGGQRVEDLTLLDPDGEVVISLDTFVTDSSLYTILTNGLVNGKTKLSNFNATILRESSGKTNLQESLGDGVLPIYFPGNHSITVSNVHGEIQHPSSSSGFTLQASGQTKQGNVTGDFHFDFQMRNDEIKWNADVKHFPVDVLEAIVSINQPEFSGILRSLLGESINFSIHETTQGHERSFNLNAQTPTLTTTVNGKVHEGVLTLSSPAKMTLNASPEFLKILALNFEGEVDWRLLNSVEAELNLDSLSLPLDFMASGIQYHELNDFFIKGDFHIPKADLLVQTNPEIRIQLQDFTARVDTSKNGRNLLFHLGGSLFQQGKSIKVGFETKIKKPSNLNQLLVSLGQPSELEFAFENVSTSLLDDLLGSNGHIAEILGRDFTLRVLSSSEDLQSMRLSLLSDKVNLPNINMKVDQAIQVGEDWRYKDFSGHISIETLTLNNSRSSLRSLEIPWKIEKGLKTVSASFTGVANEQTFDGSFKLANFNSTNTLPNIYFSFAGKKFPSQFIQLFSGRNEVEPLFGATVDLNVSIDLNQLHGPVDADINGDRGYLRLRSLYAKGTINLEEPLVVETTGTPQLGKQVLSSFAPVFRELIAAENPIKLTIYPDKFSFPLMATDFRNMQIGSAVLELGKLHFNNAGDVKKLFDVLRPVRSEQISIWTTPLYLSMKDGVLAVHRMDMLIMDHYPIATWGKIDLVKDSVNMVLGITGRTLAIAFNLDNLDSNIMVQLPIQGSVRNAKIDSSKATTRIGALLAQKEGSPEGLIVGTVLDLANLANGKQGKVPPPTTNPLPWADKLISEESDANHPRRHTEKDSKEVIDPLKGIKKEASKVLKELFR
ncbi:MAG: hypothetical protein K940chlam7_00476 [Chlamydiae bacterium]|nr:hypothetical protein [Chlamydiota bacterium]